jgi:hypothetical protein
MAEKKVSREDRLNTLQSEIRRLVDENHERTENDTLPRREAERITNDIRYLREQHAALIKEGAKACPTCLTISEQMDLADSNVHGMVRRPSYVDKNYGDMPTLYEIGCIIHPERSVAPSAEKAVERWNNDDYTT